MKKLGFTLAEILVTMTVVGVIAALTVPAIVSNTTESQIGPKLAKAVSTFEQANESLLNARASDTLTDAGLVTINNDNFNAYITGLATFLKIVPEGTTTFVTKDNMRFTLDTDKFQINTANPAYMQRIGDVEIDTDASNGERVATDTFYFSWWNDGSLRPKGGTNWEGGAYDCEKDASGVCKKDGDGKEILEANARDSRGGNSHWQKKCAANTSPSDGKFCAGHIFENNLKVLYK